MKLHVGIALSAFLLISHFAKSQSYTSLADGAWTTAANWNNTGGYGTSTPPLSGYNSGTITMNNNMTITGDYTLPNGTLNIAAGKSLTVSGNLSESGGATINVSGTLTISGDASINANFNILPGGKVIIVGNATVLNSNYLNVGTAVAPPAYADLVIEKNLYLYQSGDVTFNKNSRVSIGGNVTDDGNGGVNFKLLSGAQVYVKGNIALTGGSDNISNANGVTPIGLYVNGTTTNTGGGASTTANKGNKATLQTNDAAFYTWLSSQPGSPLPVTLTSFTASDISASSVTLEWITSSELNFDYFILERSADGIIFTEMTHLTGHGTSTVEHRYEWIDTNPFADATYYRLTSVDFDGKTEVFRTIKASITDSKKEIQVYPNPVESGSDLTVLLNFNSESPIIVEVIRIDGTTSRFTIQTTSGTFPVAIAPGYYQIKISVDNVSVSQRLLVK